MESSAPSSRLPPTAVPISIVPAQESDVQTLAHIAATSMAVDLLHRAVYPSNNPLDVTPQQSNQERELQRSLRNPDARVFKAVTKETREIVGYALFRFEGKDETKAGHDGAGSAPPATVTNTVAPAAGATSGELKEQAAPVAPGPSFPPGTNVELMSRLMKGIRGVHAQVMGEKPHVWWTSLMVLPAYQRMGIGTKLMRYGFDELGAGALPIWLATQARARHVYETLGFEEVGVVDVDFGEFMGPYMGFGVHRSVCMVRQPGGGPSLEGRPKIAPQS